MNTKQDFYIDCSYQNNVCILKLNGFLDAHTYTILEEQLKKCINNSFYNILLDLDNLTYLSSAGLGAFMMHLETIRIKNGDIILMNLSTSISEIINMLHFNEIFKIVNNKEEAFLIFEHKQ